MITQDVIHRKASTGLELTVTQAALELILQKGKSATIWLYSRPLGAG